jgi:pilus assembly protein CpaB
MLGAAATCAGLAASSVSRYTNDVRAQVGPLVPVVVAHDDIPAGSAARSLELRHVPARFAPPGALRSVAEAAGYRAAVGLRRGDYVTASSLAVRRDPPEAAASGGRLVEISISGAGSLADALEAGAHVDVLITTDRGGGPGRTYLALQDAELVGFAPAAGGRASATLRVSLRHAVLLAAAQNFARELRLVPRPPGDRRRLGPVGVTATGLGG